MVLHSFLLSCRIIHDLLPKFIKGPKGPEAKIAKRMSVGQSHFIILINFSIAMLCSLTWLGHCMFLLIVCQVLKCNIELSEHSDRPDDIEAFAFFRPMSIRLQPANGNTQDNENQWWVVEECSAGPALTKNSCHNIELVFLNNKVSPPSLGFLAGHG